MFNIKNGYLHRILLNPNPSVSTLEEYAAYCNLSIEEVLKELNDLIINEFIYFEPSGSDIFLLINDEKKSYGSTLLLNTWSRLRINLPINSAKRYYKLYQELILSGWEIEIFSERFLPESSAHTILQVKINDRYFPVVPFPKLTSEENIYKILNPIVSSDNRLFFLIIHAGTLDLEGTKIRKFLLEQYSKKSIDTVILESPNYNPYLVSSKEGSIPVKNVTLSYLENSY